MSMPTVKDKKGGINMEGNNKNNKDEKNGSSKTQITLDDNLSNRIKKANRLKEYAITQGFEVDDNTLTIINELASIKCEDITSEKRIKFDRALSELTRLTFPVTIDTLSSESESIEYQRFKKVLFLTGILTLFVAILGFSLSVAPIKNIPAQVGNSILALSLGLLGAVVYSLFNVLRVIPPQAFNPTDEYANYARLLLGLLLGWVFYFTFALDKFQKLCDVEKIIKSDAIYLLIPFVAGYSTKFVISILERVILALETAIGVEDKRDTAARKRRK